jgi:hypothetical protein
MAVVDPAGPIPDQPGTVPLPGPGGPGEPITPILPDPTPTPADDPAR